ncbi:MAG: hypothetical protein KDD35_02935 [Bdellovibrionales bacterium]|nr:hypothetical protein [Bdellovibrionales bacterium]
MNKFKLVKTSVLLTTCLALTPFALASTSYQLTITNGSKMPISPAAIYIVKGNSASAEVGVEASVGYIQLCQTGNPSTRLNELKANPLVQSTIQTAAPILPGKSITVEIEVKSPRYQSIHFEAMYGKTKDICGVGSFNSHSLVALKQHLTSEVIQRDSTLVTGAFSEPDLKGGIDYFNSGPCSSAIDALACLREISEPASNKGVIRFFSGYLPSLLNALEAKYGSTDVQGLIIPSSGAIQLKLKLKH